MINQKLILPICILLGCVILGGFYYASQVNEQRLIKQQLDLSSQKVSDFQKKIDCNKYKDQVEEKINNYNASQKPERKSQNNALSENDPEQTFGVYLSNKELVEFFYSPKLDSCLYVEVDKTLLKTSGSSEPGGYREWWSPSYEYYNLVDILSGKKIESIRTINRSERVGFEKEVNDIINKYK